jgi:hypothetical protein
MWLMYNHCCLAVNPIHYPRLIGGFFPSLLIFLMVTLHVMEPKDWFWYTAISTIVHFVGCIMVIAMMVWYRTKTMRIFKPIVFIRAECVLMQHIILIIGTAYIGGYI